MSEITSFSSTDLTNLEKYYRISLMNKVSGLKSANLIATKSGSGHSNVAIFNSVMHIGANPAYMGFIMRPLNVERETYQNIKEQGHFTINQVTGSIHKQAHQTSANYQPTVSEFDACGLSEVYLNDFPIPFVDESPIKIGLSYQEEHEIKVNGTIMIIGKVETLILPTGLIKEDGDIDFGELDGVAVGGLDTYYKCERIGKYDYARP